MTIESIRAYPVLGSESGIWPFRRRMYDVIFTNSDGIQTEITVKAGGGNKAIRIAKEKLQK